MLAIEQSAESMEPTARGYWNWFGGRFTRPLRRYRLLHFHFATRAKGRIAWALSRIQYIGISRHIEARR
jgi:hypothetical protein